MRGEVSTFYALSVADDLNLDLVEVSSAKEGSLAICKIMDYGKIKYERYGKTSEGRTVFQRQMKMRPL